MMPATNIQSVDTRGLSQVFAEMAALFYQRGASPTMIERFVTTEAALLAADAADILPPKSAESADKKILSDVKKFLDRPFSDRNQSDRYFKDGFPMESESYAGFTWLTAGKNFLLGINDEDNLLKSSSADDAYQIFRTGQKTGSRGKAYVRMGKRGNQPIVRLNRTLVSKSAFNSVRAKVKLGIGKAKASFAAPARALGLTRKFPAFVERHIATVQNEGRAILDTSGLANPENPTITFGSTAPGVESNPQMVKSLESAVTDRQFKAAAKLKKLVAGAVYNLNQGTVYRVGNRDLAEEEI